MNGRITLVDGDYDSCEAQARVYAIATGSRFIHSFDEVGVIRGHRSLFDEVDEAVGHDSTIFVPVGGGGMLAACLSHRSMRRSRIVGVELDTAAAMHRSLVAGERVRLTHMDGSAEGLMVRQVGRIGYRLARASRTPIVQVTSAQIDEAIRLLWNHAGIRAEGAGAASLAAALAYAQPAGTAVCIVSGGNIDDNVFASILGRPNAVGLGPAP